MSMSGQEHRRNQERLRLQRQEQMLYRQNQLLAEQTQIARDQASAENKKLDCHQCGKQIRNIVQGLQGWYCGVKCLKEASDTRPPAPFGRNESFEWSPIPYAAYTGNVRALKNLMAKGYSLTGYDEDENPLELALRNRKESAALLILCGGGKPNERSFAATEDLMCATLDDAGKPFSSSSSLSQETMRLCEEAGRLKRIADESGLKAVSEYIRIWCEYKREEEKLSVISSRTGARHDYENRVTSFLLIMLFPGILYYFFAKTPPVLPIHDFISRVTGGIWAMIGVAIAGVAVAFHINDHGNKHSWLTRLIIGSCCLFSACGVYAVGKLLYFTIKFLLNMFSH